MKHIKRINQFENESNNQKLPKTLYHATYKAILPKIKKIGLDTRNAEKVWNDSKAGIIYLADNYHEAGDFAENAEEVSDEIYNSGIVVLHIPSNRLDGDRIFKDRNVRSNGHQGTYEYHGQIPWDVIEKYTNY